MNNFVDLTTKKKTGKNFTIPARFFRLKKLEMPPARLERATHSLAYLTWFPKPYFLRNKLKVWTIS